MDVGRPSASESGRCQACGRFFVREASLTKHLRSNCTATHQRSRQLWKNGAFNIKKLNTSLSDSRKHLREEVQPHNNERGQVVQPVGSMNINHGFEIVSVQLEFFSNLIHAPFV
jgi:hypothetical protein